MLLPKDANFPLLITLPQPSTKLSLTAHYPSTKSEEGFLAGAWMGSGEIQGERISSSQRVWVLSVVVHPFITIPAASPQCQTSFFIPVICGKIQAPGKSERHKDTPCPWCLMGIRIAKVLLIIGCCQSTPAPIITTAKRARGHQ